MESQTGESMVTLTGAIAQIEARMESAAAVFERAAALLEGVAERSSSATGDVAKIVAQVETGREAELARKLEAAEHELAELRAQLEARAEARPEAKSARRTVPASTAQFLAKQGITTLEQVEAGALDAALTGLSLEQRLAVKAQLLRAGVVS
jgi:hypothetical protein